MNIKNYVKYSYFCDDDGINIVTLRLWKFSDFSSRHSGCSAGDDIMYHILVEEADIIGNPFVGNWVDSDIGGA